MTWFGWTLTVMFSLQALVVVCTIGDYRRPLGKAEALVAILSTAVFVWGMATVGTAA